MRAIDADALIEKIRKLPNAGIRWLVSAEAVFDTILNAPTIEPRKGKWIFVGSEYLRDGWNSYICECDQCHHRIKVREITDERFCSFCGAEMEIEKNDT